MKRLSSILCLVIGLASAAEKPNIVLIITDDQSWDSLAFMGGKVHTPRIDRMAKEGLFFTDFNVTSTVCSPSRYSFLTGRYAGRCEGELFMKEHPPGDQTQVENIGELEPDRWNLAKVLQKNGYRTGFVGSRFATHKASSFSGTSSISLPCPSTYSTTRPGWKTIGYLGSLCSCGFA